MDDKAAAEYPSPGAPPGTGLVGNLENAGLHNDHSFETTTTTTSECYSVYYSLGGWVSYRACEPWPPYTRVTPSFITVYLKSNISVSQYLKRQSKLIHLSLFSSQSGKVHL